MLDVELGRPLRVQEAAVRCGGVKSSFLQLVGAAGVYMVRDVIPGRNSETE